MMVYGIYSFCLLFFFYSVALPLGYISDVVVVFYDMKLKVSQLKTTIIVSIHYLYGKL